MKTLFEAGGEDGRTDSIALLTEPEEVAQLIRLFEAVALEQGWRPGDQLWTYRNASTHIAAIVGGKIVGGLQAVAEAREAGFPYRHVWPEVEAGGKSTLHVTILALEREYRGRPRLFASLCVELWRCCMDRCAEQIVIEATPPTLRLYRRIGWPLEIIGELRPHWGDDRCYLCRMGVRQAAEALSLKARRSASHRALVEQACRDDPAGLWLTGVPGSEMMMSRNPENEP